MTGQPTQAGHTPRTVVFALGVTQIVTWGSSYYLPAVLGQPIAAETGWPLAWIIGGLTIGLLTSGLCSPRIGGWIQRRGGRPVLCASSISMSLGLMILALSSNLAVYACAWVVIGVAMGCGMYDAAFATLGRLYGVNARRHITNLTLFGGLTSAIAWPASALLVHYIGWRGTCWTYALIHLAFSLPIHWRFIPDPPPALPVSASVAKINARPSWICREFFLLAFVISASAAVSGSITVNLLTILQAHGHSLASAVALGALVGPAMVGARIVEKASSERLSPTQLLVCSLMLFVSCIAILLLDARLWAMPALIAFGAGVGVGAIARGTVPLAIFGVDHYAGIVGRVAMPALIAQAVAPSICALIAEWWGVGQLLWGLGGLAAIAACCAAALAYIAANARLRSGA